jgi:4-hydroxybenzoate polyprenyltransferase
MQIISGLIQSTRLLKSLAVGIIIALTSSSIEYGIGALFFLTFSFLFNDWVDASKDSLGHPERAIPMGKITREQAGLFSAALLLVALGYSKTFLPEFMGGFILIYSLSVLYSFFLKPNVPLLATPVWSAAVAVLFVQPFTRNITVYIAVTAVVVAYELLLDYRDRISDKAFCKTPTLANILGKNIFVLAGGILCFGIILFIYTVRY